MKCITAIALIGGIICNVQAAPLAPSDLERAAFLSMTLDPDYERSRIGVRMLGQQFPNDDSLCDYIAEKLLQEPAVPVNNLAFDATQWYIVTIRDKCTGRYLDTLKTLRQRFTHEKLLKHIDAAMAAPVDFSVPQYRQSGVDLLAKQIDLLQLLGDLRRSSASARGVMVGATFGEVLDRAGFPQDLRQMDFRIARYGRSNALVAHYRNAGMLIFRRDYARNRWVLGERLDELAPVSATYQGRDFGRAQSIACLRGQTFRAFVKKHGRQIRRDSGLLWAMANRLTHVPLPVDRYEEDGMVVAVKLITTSGDPEALMMLRQIGAAPGDSVPAEARAYARKLEQKQALPEAEPDEPADEDESPSSAKEN